MISLLKNFELIYWMIVPNIYKKHFFQKKVNMSFLNLFTFLGIQKNLLPGNNIWKFQNQFASNLWNIEDHITTEQPSSVTVNSMEQVTIQEIFIPLQQNMVVIYKAEEAQKHFIGRVIHFDAIGNVSIQ